uniref:Uncharacterized protein n=1 Tax=Hypsizygus marmoreus TaxID=39966 RepID=A0A4V1DVF9_HYPMA|nr:hypothetical protein [Hypsizygus marmoreus]QKJ80207.1 hypothetical protein [Hypsizygus marmoreus]
MITLLILIPIIGSLFLIFFLYILSFSFDPDPAVHPYPVPPIRIPQPSIPLSPLGVGEGREGVGSGGKIGKVEGGAGDNSNPFILGLKLNPAKLIVRSEQVEPTFSPKRLRSSRQPLFKSVGLMLQPYIMKILPLPFVSLPLRAVEGYGLVDKSGACHKRIKNKQQNKNKNGLQVNSITKNRGVYTIFNYRFMWNISIFIFLILKLIYHFFKLKFFFTKHAELFSACISNLSLNFSTSPFPTFDLFYLYPPYHPLAGVRDWGLGIGEGGIGVAGCGTPIPQSATLTGVGLLYLIVFIFLILILILIIIFLIYIIIKLENQSTLYLRFGKGVKYVKLIITYLLKIFQLLSIGILIEDFNFISPLSILSASDSVLSLNTGNGGSTSPSPTPISNPIPSLPSPTPKGDNGIGGCGIGEGAEVGLGIRDPVLDMEEKESGGLNITTSSINSQLNTDNLNLNSSKNFNTLNLNQKYEYLKEKFYNKAIEPNIPFLDWFIQLLLQTDGTQIKIDNIIETNLNNIQKLERNTQLNSHAFIRIRPFLVNREDNSLTANPNIVPYKSSSIYEE